MTHGLSSQKLRPMRPVEQPLDEVVVEEPHKSTVQYYNLRTGEVIATVTGKYSHT